MYKKTHLILIAILAIALLSSGCRPEVETVPSVTETSTPVITSTGSHVIDGTNAVRMILVNQIQLQPYGHLVWVKDSQSFWVVSELNASRVNAASMAVEDDFNAVEPGSILDASPDGSKVAYDPEGTRASLVVHDVEQDTNITITPTSVYAGGLFTPDGKKILTISMDQWQATLWDAFSGDKVGDWEGFETAAPVYEAMPAADERTLIWKARGTLQLQDIASQAMGNTFSHEDFITAFALSPDGKVLATAAAGTINGNFSPVVYLWDAVSGEMVMEMAFTDPVASLAFSPDNDLVAIGSGKSVIIVSSDAQTTATFAAHEVSVDALAFSPDGRTLLTAGSGGLVKVWQVSGD